MKGLVAALLLLAAPSAYGLEKCVGTDGKVTYSDRACAGSAKRHRTPGVPGGCAVDGLETKLDLKVRMPRWNAPAGTSPEVMRRWDHYLDALRVHEAGHLQVGRDFDAGFRRTASMPWQASIASATRTTTRRRGTARPRGRFSSARTGFP